MLSLEWHENINYVAICSHLNEVEHQMESLLFALEAVFQHRSFLLRSRLIGKFPAMSEFSRKTGQLRRQVWSESRPQISTKPTLTRWKRLNPNLSTDTRRYRRRQQQRKQRQGWWGLTTTMSTTCTSSELSTLRRRWRDVCRRKSSVGCRLMPEDGHTRFVEL